MVRIGDGRSEETLLSQPKPSQPRVSSRLYFFFAKIPPLKTSACHSVFQEKRKSTKTTDSSGFFLLNFPPFFVAFAIEYQ